MMTVLTVSLKPEGRKFYLNFIYIYIYIYIYIISHTNSILLEQKKIASEQES